MPSAANKNLGAVSRLARVLRVLKLLRILRLVAVTNRWKKHMNLDHIKESILRFSLLIIVVTHWCAALCSDGLYSPYTYGQM